MEDRKDQSNRHRMLMIGIDEPFYSCRSCSGGGSNFPRADDVHLISLKNQSCVISWAEVYYLSSQKNDLSPDQCQAVRF